MLKADSFIFDMDGTLWDAVDSYCAVWDEAYRRLGQPYVLTRDSLKVCMGLPLDEIFARVSPGATIDYDTFKTTLRAVEAELMPRFGGRLYPGVRETLQQLNQRGYRLFMVSNCSPIGLPNFLTYTGLTRFFTDTLSFGQTGRGKDANIQALIKRYNLAAPWYVGDIEPDSISAHAGGAKMIGVTYGFGRCSTADIEIDTLPAMLQLFH